MGYKLKKLKFDVIQWKQRLKSKNQRDLFLIEAELNELSDVVDENLFSLERK